MMGSKGCDICGKDLGISAINHPALWLCSQQCYDRLIEYEHNTTLYVDDDFCAIPEDSRRRIIEWFHTKNNDGEGIKHDADKPRYDLLPADALHEVVTIFTYGSSKYQPRNWEKGMSWGRCFGAAMRHLWAFWRGEDRDPESGHLHLAHAATNCLFLLAYYLRKKGEDDRV